MSSSSYLPSRSSTTHRRAPQPSPNPNSTGPQSLELDQAPTPKPVFQFIAFGLIIFLGLLQFLPATHFRDPSDPFRKWVPFNTSLSKLRSSSDAKAGLINSNGQEDGMVHIVSWMECLDLRLLAVLINSTLSSSRYPDLLHFHFFVPKGNEDKVSFYKLKVLFPHSNLDIFGQEEVKEVIRTTIVGEKHSVQNFAEIAPFIIPSVHQLLSKFIYISPIVIVKWRVEELTGVDLSNYAIAAAEDCSKRLNTYVNPDVLDAIQRSASKPWVSETPYAKNCCMPDLNVVLIDGSKLEKDFLEAFLWWTQVLNWRERSNGRNPAVALALYNRYLKLSNPWLVKDSTSFVFNESLSIHYDGPKIVCSEFGDGDTLEPGHGNLWRQHLPPMSDQIIGS
ncbi:Hexosyltransferase [Melia azedarach]|uniref:Hexosyltransferase n=1 Tax=Melia azedarach TaxID=155640 RepID=A0ACC1WTQ7_MELAZ|nr:Hexosyltransferase [Melia azedarach]